MWVGTRSLVSPSRGRVGMRALSPKTGRPGQNAGGGGSARPSCFGCDIYVVHRFGYGKTEAGRSSPRVQKFEGRSVRKVVFFFVEYFLLPVFFRLCGSAPPVTEIDDDDDDDGSGRAAMTTRRRPIGRRQLVFQHGKPEESMPPKTFRVDL